MQALPADWIPPAGRCAGKLLQGGTVVPFRLTPRQKADHLAATREASRGQFSTLGVVAKTTYLLSSEICAYPTLPALCIDPALIVCQPIVSKAGLILGIGGWHDCRPADQIDVGFVDRRERLGAACFASPS